MSITDKISSSLQDYSAEGKPAAPGTSSALLLLLRTFPCCILAPSNPPHWRWAGIFYYETVTEQGSSSHLLQQVRLSKILPSPQRFQSATGGKSRLKRACQVYHCVLVSQKSWWMLSLPQQSLGHYSVNFTDHSWAGLSLKLVMAIPGSPNLLPASQ